MHVIRLILYVVTICGGTRVWWQCSLVQIRSKSQDSQPGPGSGNSATKVWFVFGFFLAFSDFLIFFLLESFQSSESFDLYLVDDLHISMKKVTLFRDLCGEFQYSVTQLWFR
jgi:hypothetical protein